MSLAKAIADNDGKMKKTLEFLHEELRGVRTGRASTGLIEHLRVEYYGNPTPLKSLASLTVPQADQILIKPFDPACIKDIEKAIKNSDLSMTPMVDGKMIRLSVPPLSGERRKALVGQVKQNGEHAKVTVRNTRRDTIKHLEELEKAGTITEDELDKGKKQVEAATKESVDKIDGQVKLKSDEIMST
ncbi:MAG: ribosome recycling factor [Planctomycetes bacterium GWF2_50_10]|nr:MAG: ribosome recycling factor [Planctomycetes bacterium GWF2_50_10]